MKIVNRLVRIGRPESRFGGFGNRMMLESVCLFVVIIAFGVLLAEKFLKNLENLQHLVQIGRPDRRFGPNSARIVLSKAYVDWGPQTKLQ